MSLLLKTCAWLTLSLWALSSAAIGMEDIEGRLYPDRIPLWLAVSKGGLILEERFGEHKLGSSLQVLADHYHENVELRKLELCDTFDLDASDFDHIALGRALNQANLSATENFELLVANFLRENETHQTLISHSLELGRNESRYRKTDYATVYEGMDRADVAEMFSQWCTRQRNEVDDVGT